MISQLAARVSAILMLVIAALHTRYTQVARGRERGDVNIQYVIYAALAVTLGVLIAAAITAYVNNKLPAIGGGD